MTEDTRQDEKLLRLIQYSLGRKRRTFGHGYEAGYQSLRIDGKEYDGMRDTYHRIRAMQYDFSGKRVLDLGCNVGGLLGALRDEIAVGVGIDNNPRCINAANRLASLTNAPMRFYTFDLTKEPLDLLHAFIDTRYDVILMLSLAVWVPNWFEVVQWCWPVELIYETNGKSPFQAEQLTKLRETYQHVVQLTEMSADDRRPGKHSTLRKMYRCSDR